jgi:adenosylcobinamide-GDP ribazoletransferase
VVLTAVRGAVAFLTRLPVDADDAAWDAFRATPVAFPLAGYVVGVLAALPLSLPLPTSTRVAAFLVALYLVTGVTHVDGLADLGDVAAAHGVDDPAAVMRDERVGSGGVLLVALTLLSLAFGVLAAVALVPRLAVAVVVAAEVGAKAGVALMVTRSPAAHEGLGSAFVEASDGASLRPVAVALLPAIVLGAWFAPGGARGGVAAAASLLAAVVTARYVARWATGRLGGVSGDVLGAGNELARAVAVNAGVVAWTLF